MGKLLFPEISTSLAECVGILIGDGGISNYQVTVSLNHITDKSYSRFVVALFTGLFGESPQVYHRTQESVYSITYSRVQLVRYLSSLGLPIGNKIKQKIDIPIWVKNDSNLTIACLRGLVDTDGCVFTHRYKVKGREYSYKKLSFTSASPLLLSSVYTVLTSLDFHPRKGVNHDIWLERKDDVRRYFAVIGSHNPKHLRRYFS
jgi:intein/homing endonuclease